MQPLIYLLTLDKTRVSFTNLSDSTMNCTQHENATDIDEMSSSHIIVFLPLQHPETDGEGTREGARQEAGRRGAAGHRPPGKQVSPAASILIYLNLIFEI